MFENLVFFDNVGLRYSQANETLSDITFAVNQGDFYFLTGVSGAGKSSLLRLMDISLKPTRGFINILGKEISVANEHEISKLRRQIGIIFQDCRLINEISVFDNIALPLKIMKADNDEIVSKVEDILKWVELFEYKEALPLTLSGGQQQIISIARAVINNPSLILADEPTGNVDIAMSNKIMSLFHELNKQGTAVILSTHDLDLVKKSNRKILSLKEGKLRVLSPKNF